MYTLNTNQSKIEIIMSLWNTYELMRKNNDIPDDICFQQEATIDSIISDCREETISDDELSDRVQEAVDEFREVCQKYGVEYSEVQE